MDYVACSDCNSKCYCTFDDKSAQTHYTPRDLCETRGRGMLFFSYRSRGDGSCWDPI